MSEYPKALYLKGWEDLSESMIVMDEKEETEARKQGYKSLAESVEAEPKRTRKKAE